MANSSYKSNGEDYTARDNTRVSSISGYGLIPNESKGPITHKIDVTDGPMGYVPFLGDGLQAWQAKIDYDNGDVLSAGIGAGTLLMPPALSKFLRKTKPTWGPWVRKGLNYGMDKASSLSPRVRAFLDKYVSGLEGELSKVDVERVRKTVLDYQQRRDLEKAPLLPGIENDLPNYIEAKNIKVVPATNRENIINRLGLTETNSGLMRAGALNNGKRIVVFPGNANSEILGHEFRHSIQDEFDGSTLPVPVGNTNIAGFSIPKYDFLPLARLPLDTNPELDGVRSLLKQYNPNSSWHQKITELDAEVERARQKFHPNTTWKELYDRADERLDKSLGLIRDRFHLQNNDEANYLMKTLYDNGYADGGKFIRAPKYNNGTARFMELLDDYASMLYSPYEPSVPEVRTPIRYEPQPHYGLYEYPSSTGLAEGYPITVPGMVAASTVTRPEKAVEDLFSEEAMARRALKQRYAESNFDNKAKSHAGAMGAWQIMPITYKDYLGRGRGKAGDLNDPEYNRKVRDWVMGIIPRDLQDLYSENDAPRVKLAKIYGAYNWGTGNMRKYLRKQRDAGVDISNDTSWVEGLNPETKRYIKYLALDEDIPDSTYTNRAFEEAAAKRGYMKDGGPINLFYGGGPYSVAPLGGDYLTYLQTIPEVSGGMIEPSVVTAPLPAKFNGSQEAARRYAEGYQKGAKPVSEAMNRTGKDIFNAVDTVVGFTPTPAGAIMWLGHMGADLAEGEYGKVAKDAGLAVAMGLGLRAIGKGATFLKNYWDEIGNFGEDTFRAFTDRVPGRVSTNFTYSAPVARSAMEAAPTAAKAVSAPYEIENLGGGYMLKSLMRGNPLEKQISKNGTVNVNNVKALVGKGSKVEQAVVDKVLASEEFAGKKSIDYNRFRKAVQDELITYSRTPDTRWADYGINRLGITESEDLSHLRNIERFAQSDRFEVVSTDTIGQARLWRDKTTGDILNWDGVTQRYLGEHDVLNSGPGKNTYTFSSSRIPSGSSKHYGPNTLGHSRTYTTADEPDVLHVMESQSDWAQEGRVAKNAAYVKDRMAKHPGTESDPDSWLSYAKGKIETREKEIESIKEMLKTGISENGDKLEPHAIKQIEEELLPAAERRLAEAKSYFYGPTPQEIYLSDNYTSRQIQENLRYAAEKGQTKMRYPTRETAAKIEGYSKSRSGVFELEPELRAKYDDFMASRQQKVNDIIRESAPEGYIDDYLQRWEEIPDEAIEVMDEAQRADLQRRSKLSWDFEKSDAGAEMKRKINEVYRKYNERKWLDENVPETYLPEHETILRKYDAFPKQFKKLYKNADVRTVTDPKGNTWYEVDVPENYLQQEWAYEDGGKIYIKPSHRGRLTELKERTGKTEAELYNDGNPAHKKMVVFARNSRKWHGDGGLLDKLGSVYGNDRARMLDAIRKIRQK